MDVDSTISCNERWKTARHEDGADGISIYGEWYDGEIQLQVLN